MKKMGFAAGVLGLLLTAACASPVIPEAATELPVADAKGCITVNNKPYQWTGVNIDKDFAEGGSDFSKDLRARIDSGELALGEALSKDALEIRSGPRRDPDKLNKRDYLLHAQTAGLYKPGCNP